MGLASALTTALSGLTAAEAKIDVAGNNLANSQTVGFKESKVNYSTQFLQTLSLGSAPTASNGGTNPRQYGLGVQVSSISANHTQGTIDASTNQTDMAIRGDGLFVVQGPSGEQLFTRTGIFSTNANNELVTPDGNRLLGYGINDDFQVQATTLTPLSIPLGTSAVAQATTQVTLEGKLPPLGAKAEVAGVIESQTLGDGSLPAASNGLLALNGGASPIVNATVLASAEAAGTHPENATYEYRFVLVDSAGTESTISSPVSITTPVGNGLPDNAINISGLPAPSAGYENLRVYRTAANGSEFFRLTDLAPGATTFVDNNSVPLSNNVLNQDSLTGSYSYVVTFSVAGQPETRPGSALGPFSVVDGKVQLQGLPTPPVPGPNDTFPPYDTVNIYRTTQEDPNSYYFVGTAPAGSNFTDGKPDSEIRDLTTSGNRQANLDGPAVTSTTLLTDVVLRQGTEYAPAFQLGTLSLEPQKGGRNQGAATLEVTPTTTIAEFTAFIEQATGIVRTSGGVNLPFSQNLIEGESGTLAAGVSVVDGKIRIVSNNGEPNAIDISLGDIRIKPNGSQQEAVSSLGFNSVQDAVGIGAVADFLAYDSLGIPISVRVTSVLESSDGDSTTYRWFAESPDNGPASGNAINVGTGLITMDSEGNVMNVTNTKVSIGRNNAPSISPLEFDLNFDIVSGLASSEASLVASQQDGSGPGTLTNFTINRDGSITGLFSNNTSRPLGQIILGVFANPQGLEQIGQNLFGSGVNAGFSLRQPGVNGGGELIANALELSNTDIGRSLIDLSLASTLYRGNSRVITTTQTLLDELLNLRR